MKSVVFLMLLILLNIIAVAKDKLSTSNKTKQGKAGIEGKFNVKSGQMDITGISSFYYEGFDEYTSGDYLAAVDLNWSTWSNDPGGPEDGLITDEQALSEFNSVKVEGSTDLILPMGEKNSGTYLLNFNLFVPSGNVGYFNISHFDTPDIDFALHCYFNQEGVGIFTASGNNTPFQYNNNEWVNVNLKVDLDNDLAGFSINEILIYSWTWSDLAEGGGGIRQLGFIDLYANNSYGTPLMYFDDVMLFKTETQQVALNMGWNIMSFGVMPGNRNLKDILQPLIDAGKLKKVMDEAGNVIEDWGVSNGGWINFIEDIENTEGYKINVTSATSLNLTGIPSQLPFDIPLSAGWNIISWPSFTKQNAMDVFADLITGGQLKKVMDESGNIIENWGASNGGWQNFIGDLKPGEGYKVNVTTACTLTVDQSGLKSEEIIPELTASSHFITAYKGNGTDHMNINLVNLAESGIMEGDEIGIFDGNICVGSAKINFKHSTFNFKQTSISIPVSSNDGSVGKNGFSDGNPVILKLFRDGTEYPLQFETLDNSKTTYEKGNSMFARVNADLNTGISSLSNEFDIKCYPNPFSDKLNFEFVSDRNAHAVLEIFNTTGQSISRLLDRQVEEGVINRVEYAPQNIISGVYIYKLTIDGNTSVGRVIYRK